MATVERGELLSKQVEEALKEGIREGSFSPGRQLPPENQLASIYGVSRATVRAALAHLQRDGAVVRRQGSGTYVTRAAMYMDSRLEEMWNCEDMIRARGHEPSIGWLDFEETFPDDRTRAKLLLGSRDHVLIIRKVFLADGQPVIHCVDYLPRGLIQKPFKPEDLAGQVFDLLEEFGGERATYYVAEVVPTVADGNIAERLECPRGTPLLLFDEVAYNFNDKAICCSLVHHRREGVRLRLVQSR